MTELLYYKFKEPEAPPRNAELIGYSYQGFRLTRDNEHLLWQIQTLDGGKPHPELRSLFTSQTRAKECIDDYLTREAENQHKAEQHKK